MKRIFLPILLCLFAFQIANAQSSQRIVLFEEATNTGCPPCAAQNPAFDALLAANAGKVAVIKYHWNFPSPTDPFWLHNWSENNYRIESYYGINGVPSARMDGASLNGGSYAGAPANLTQAKLDARYNSPSGFDIQVTQTRGANNIVTVDIDVEALSDNAANDMKIHCVVVEKEKHYFSSVGSNGEKDFYQTMRKMVTGRFGQPFSPVVTGIKRNYSYTYTIDSIWDDTQLQVVTFIQSRISRIVYQANMTEVLPVVGVENQIDANALYMGNGFPNPTTGMFFIPFRNINNEMTLEVTDMNGRLIKSSAVRSGINVLELDMSGVEAGLYLYRLLDKGAVVATNKLSVLR